MKIAIAADHGGFALKEALKAHLREAGHEVTDHGTTSSSEAVDYPVFARAVAESLASGEVERGVVVDGAGIGSAMVANKTVGVRAATVYDLSSARNSREHNDANCLCLGAGLIGESLARQILDLWLATDCKEERHQRRVSMIEGERWCAASAPTGRAGDSDSPVLAGSDSLSESDLERIVDRLQQLLAPGLSVCDSPPCVASNPEGARAFREMGVGSLSAGLEKTGRIPEDLANMIDHTLLRSDAREEEIRALCEEALEHKFRSVCVNPAWISLVRSQLERSTVIPCSVVGFPLGASTPEIKALEARRAIRDGAKEIDMVLNIGALKSGDEALVLRDIRAVVEACRDGSAVCKVILETALLSKDEIRTACLLSRKARAHFVKTSTGFGPGGATSEDVALMSSLVSGAGMEVKASGGIRSYSDAKRMVEAGASRIGASASVAIVEEAMDSLTEMRRSHA
jgi:deoxyribose-phosphate aldolase